MLFAAQAAVVSAEQQSIGWDECVTLAKKNHPALKSSLEQVRQNEAVVWVTTSPLLPQISANANYAKAKSSSSSYTGSSATDTYSYGITGEQVIFDGGKLIYDRKNAKMAVESARTTYIKSSSTVRYNLRSAFVSLLKAQQGLIIAKKIEARRTRNLELVRMRYTSGKEHNGALLTAEANLAQAKAYVAEIELSIKLAQQSLSKEIGSDVLVAFTAQGELKITQAETVEPDLVKLALSTPSVKKAEATRIAADYAVSSAESQFFPTIAASASAGKTGSQWPPKTNDWSVGVGASVPIFQGGIHIAQVSKAKAVYEQAVADERTARDEAILSLKQAWNNLQTAMKTLEVQSKFLLATAERAKIADAQYSIGLITFDNWTIIDDALVSAEKSYLEAQSNALVTEAAWIYAKGETL